MYDQEPDDWIKQRKEDKNQEALQKAEFLYNYSVKKSRNRTRFKVQESSKSSWSLLFGIFGVIIGLLSVFLTKCN